MCKYELPLRQGFRKLSSDTHTDTDTMCPEKGTKMIFFVKASNKTWAILVKFGTQFPD